MTKFNDKLKNRINESLVEKQDTKNTVPHIQVQALAGTGKTTTGIQGIKYAKGLPVDIIPSDQQQYIWDSMECGKFDDIRFSSFGKAITEESAAKLVDAGLMNQGCEARTLNSLGYQAVNKQLGYKKPNTWATKDIIADIMGVEAKLLLKDRETRPVISGVEDLVDKCKQNMVEDYSCEVLEELADYYDIDISHKRSTILQMVPDVIERSKNPGKAITFTDQVWLPVVLDLPIKKCDLQIIDEAQDLNRMQQELAIKAGHRIMYVGDVNQAIYGFAGADSESMGRLESMLGDVDTFPLTVTRRCGKAIVREAQYYVPEYEAYYENAEGIVDYMKYPNQGEDIILNWCDTYGPHVQDGDLVVCRNNAPLVKQCLKFIANNTYAYILGRKVGDKLIAIANKIMDGLPTSSIYDFIAGVEEWLTIEKEKEFAKKHPSQSKIESLEDHYECLISLATGCNTTDEMIQRIDTLFTENENRQGVKLSSIHRAKGMEADTVFFLQPRGVGRPREKMKGWEIQQEDNLVYVAITRAKNRLVYVR